MVRGPSGPAHRCLSAQWRLFINRVARQHVGDTQKRGKPEMHSSCRNPLDFHWSASAPPSHGCASVPHLRYLSVSSHLKNRRHLPPLWCATRAGQLIIALLLHIAGGPSEPAIIALLLHIACGPSGPAYHLRGQRASLSFALYALFAALSIPCEKRSTDGETPYYSIKNGHARRRLDAQDCQMGMRCEQS